MYRGGAGVIRGGAELMRGGERVGRGTHGGGTQVHRACEAAIRVARAYGCTGAVCRYGCAGRVFRYGGGLVNKCTGPGKPA